MTPTSMDLDLTDADDGGNGAPLPRQSCDDAVRSTGAALSIGAREALIDLADLVASDPETATVEQTRQIALSLRGLLVGQGVRS